MTASKEQAKPTSVLGIRDFRWYLGGVAFSQIGTNGAFVAMLYHVYILTGSTFQVGIVGAARGVATIVLSPWAGHIVDRMDRKRLLQLSQLISLVVGVILAVITFSDVVQAWELWLATLFTSVAATIDSPVRKAIIPALVPREFMVHAVSLVNPTNQVGKLVGPGLAGLLIAWQGPGSVYLLDAMTYVVLIYVLATLTISPIKHKPKPGMWSGVKEGVVFVKKRPIIYQLMGLDISASLFTAYRVVLPAIALNRLHVGATGYGLLSAAVPAGALLGGVIVYRLANTSVRAGHVVLVTTALYGASAFLVAQSTAFYIAVIGALGLGLFDAIGTTIRHAAVMLETPDALQGRVQALYGMSSRGVPAIGEFNVGWMASLLGATVALSIGGLVPIVYALGVAFTSPTVRRYVTKGQLGEPDTPDDAVVAPPPGASS